MLILPTIMGIRPTIMVIKPTGHGQAIRQFKHPLDESSLQLVLKLRPHWSEIELLKTEFTEGSSNQLIGWHPLNQENEMVLVRVYGQATSQLVDRTVELRTMNWLSQLGQCAEVFATFDNGYCYEYLPGTVLTVQELSDNETWPRIAAALAKLHQLGLNGLEPTFELFAMLDRFLNLLPDAEPAKVDLKCEIDFLKKHLPRPEPEDLVFCHNDLSPRNIIRQKDRLMFIDFEYGSSNHRAFDIANHLCEFAGAGADYVTNYGLDRTFISKWCTTYLSHFDDDVTDDMIHKLTCQVEAFIPASHLLWAIWSMVQSHQPEVDFGYDAYAKCRLSDYHSHKSKVLR
ncbi:Ethanolamine kinase 2 [Halotydeus destructor]|nr:Ethanolamine kinase 2 [Halotydeus destructor]